MIEPEGLLEENKGGGRGSRAVLLKCKQKRTIPYSFLFFINQFYQYSTSQKAELDSSTHSSNSQNLEMMRCAYFRILKSGLATLASHAPFIQSKNRQMNFTSEWLKYFHFVSR